jgi:hypothetical protein
VPTCSDETSLTDREAGTSARAIKRAGTHQHGKLPPLFLWQGRHRAGHTGGHP